MTLRASIPERARPAADAFTRLLAMGGALPTARPGLDPAGSALVWLARLVLDAALCPGGEPLPRLVAERVREALIARFGPDAPTALPLLAGVPPAEGGVHPSFQAAALDARIAAAATGPWDDLGEALPLTLSSEERKTRGQYYTPEPVVALLTGRALRQRKPTSVFDPACGSGQLLTPLVARLASEGAGAEQVLRAVAGSEASPASHCLAQANLLLRLPPSEPGTLLPLPRLVCEDSLEHYGEADAPTFDLVIANPPYVGERHNKALFDDLHQRAPRLRAIASARGDLLHYFLALALERARPGGLIAFLTSAAWLQADGARRLRERLTEGARIRELVDFGEQRLFRDAPGHTSLLIVMERRGGDESPEPARWVRVTRPGALREVCGEVARALEAPEGREPRGHVESGLGEPLRGPAPQVRWSIPARCGLDAVLEHLAQAGTSLGALASVSQGLVSGADRVTNANVGALGSEGRREIDGIFVLEEWELSAAGIPRECPVLRPFVKCGDIERYGLPGDPFPRWVLYLDSSRAEAELPPEVLRHLERSRPLLAARREVRQGTMPWWRLHWPRRESLFTGPKILCPYRALRNTFAYTERPAFASADVYFVHGLPDSSHWAWLTGMLNSRVLDLWCERRGKRKGDRREYYATPLAEIPLPHPQLSAAGPSDLVDAAPIDDELPDRVAFHLEQDDLAPADRAIARVARGLIAARETPVAAGPEQIALAVIEERRLEPILDRLVALRYGLSGERDWMARAVLERPGRAGR